MRFQSVSHELRKCFSIRKRECGEGKKKDLILFIAAQVAAVRDEMPSSTLARGVP